jgi:hypothetical protein
MRKTLVAVIVLAAGGCRSVPPAPALTPLQLRMIQTREFGGTESAVVLKAMVHVFQDDGFIVRVADPALGVLAAEHESTPSVSLRFVVEATANVTHVGGRTVGRVNFHERELDKRGRVRRAAAIEDPVKYQDFFAKVEKSVFLQRSSVR